MWKHAPAHATKLQVQTQPLSILSYISIYHVFKFQNISVYPPQVVAVSFIRKTQNLSQYSWQMMKQGALNNVYHPLCATIKFKANLSSKLQLKISVLADTAPKEKKMF